MNYKKVYDNIIERAKNRKINDGEYVEKHHIIPVSLNGTNDKDNLVILYPREHYIVHLLLYKHYDSLNKKTNGKYRNEYIKMLWALSALYFLPAVKTEEGLRKRAFTGNAHIYAKFKEKFAKESSILNKERMQNLSKEEYDKFCISVSEGVKKYYHEHKSHWIGRHHKESTKKLIGSKSAIYQAGSKNSQYGTIWITNLQTGKDKKINKNEIIPEGWEKGRGGNIVKQRQLKKQQEREQKKSENKEMWIAKLRPLYKIYKTKGFKYVLFEDWTTSKQNFLQLCKKYLSEYSPGIK